MLKVNNYYKVTLCITFILSIITNYLGAIGKINNMSQKDVSLSFPTLLTPANYAFSIWSIIYIGVILVIINLIINDYNKILIYKYVILSSIVNLLWIISFSYLKLFLSSILIIILFIIIIKICITINETITNINDKNLFLFTFGTYAGWLGVASTVNILITIKSYNIDYINNFEKNITLILLIFSFICLFFIGRKIKNFMFYISIIWAFIAVIIKLIQNGYNYFDNLIVIILLGIFILIFEIFNNIKLNKKSEF